VIGMAANPMTFSADAIEFGRSVTIDAQWLAIFAGGQPIVADLGEGARDWSDGTIPAAVVWSTKPGETED
jgi:hypothetical protein